MSRDLSPAELRFLLDVNRRLTGAPDHESFLGEVRDLVKLAADAAACSLAVFNEEGTRLEYWIAADRIVPDPRKVYVARREGIAGHAAEHRRSVVVPDVPNDPRSSHDWEVNAGVRVRSKLVTTIERRGNVIAVLEALDSRAPEGFRPDDLARMEALAEGLVFPLENSLLARLSQRGRAESEALYQTSLVLNEKLELEDVLTAFLSQIAQVVPHQASAIYLVHWEESEIEWFAHRGYPPDTPTKVRLEFGQGAVGWVATHGQPLLIPDVSRETRYVNARPATRSEVVVPIHVDARVVAVFNLEADELDAFRAADVKILSAFANQAALSIERAELFNELREKERLAEELRIARDIQQSFLPPRDPELPGFDLSGANLSSKEVSGDSFDYIWITPQQLGICIADVSGKGVPAALILATFRASLRAEIRNRYAIASILDKVNSLLCESVEAGKFVTAVYGVLDLKQRRWTYANAGHNPPLLLRPGRPPEELSIGGLILGSFPDARYEEAVIDLVPGDVLVFYTDGITDAEEPGGDWYGEERLLSCLQRVADRPAREICRALLDDVHAFAGSDQLTDDQTVVVLRVGADPSGRKSRTAGFSPSDRDG